MAGCCVGNPTPGEKRNRPGLASLGHSGPLPGVGVCVWVPRTQMSELTALRLRPRAPSHAYLGESLSAVTLELCDLDQAI